MNTMCKAHKSNKPLSITKNVYNAENVVYQGHTTGSDQSHVRLLTLKQIRQEECPLFACLYERSMLAICPYGMPPQIAAVKKCNRGLQNVDKISKFIDRESKMTLFHCLVLTQVDFCNSLLYGLPNIDSHSLQMIKNAAVIIAVNVP